MLLLPYKIPRSHKPNPPVAAAVAAFLTAASALPLAFVAASSLPSVFLGACFCRGWMSTRGALKMSGAEGVGVVDLEKATAFPCKRPLPLAVCWAMLCDVKCVKSGRRIEEVRMELTSHDG